MATYQAVSAACQAVVRLLNQSWQQSLFDNIPLQFRVFNLKDFTETTITNGVSLYLYRVMVSQVQRTSPAKPKVNGIRRRPQLPVELHFILTPWAQDPSTEHQILGWMMRILEDAPSLSSGILNTVQPGVFEPEESVEIVQGQLTNEEMFRIWDVLPGDYHVSVPYIARTVRIDSELEEAEGKPVLVKELEFGVLKSP